MAAEIIPLSLQEAQLLRLLAGVFGRDQIIPQMSVRAICGDDLTEEEFGNLPTGEQWARETVCLFTVVDANSDSRLVAELVLTEDADTIDVSAMEREQFARPLFEKRGIHYVVIHAKEIALLMDPNEDLDICRLIEAKLEDSTFRIC